MQRTHTFVLTGRVLFDGNALEPPAGGTMHPGIASPCCACHPFIYDITPREVRAIRRRRGQADLEVSGDRCVPQFWIRTTLRRCVTV